MGQRFVLVDKTGEYCQFQDIPSAPPTGWEWAIDQLKVLHFELELMQNRAPMMWQKFLQNDGLLFLCEEGVTPINRYIGEHFPDADEEALFAKEYDMIAGVYAAFESAGEVVHAVAVNAASYRIQPTVERMYLIYEEEIPQIEESGIETTEEAMIEEAIDLDAIEGSFTIGKLLEANLFSDLTVLHEFTHHAVADPETGDMYHLRSPLLHMALWLEVAFGNPVATRTLDILQAFEGVYTVDDIKDEILSRTGEQYFLDRSVVQAASLRSFPADEEDNVDAAGNVILPRHCNWESEDYPEYDMLAAYFKNVVLYMVGLETSTAPQDREKFALACEMLELPRTFFFTRRELKGYRQIMDSDTRLPLEESVDIILDFVNQLKQFPEAVESLADFVGENTGISSIRQALKEGWQPPWECQYHPRLDESKHRPQSTELQR